MTNEWSLRDYILNLMHRWYFVTACFFAGALLGWLASMLWPPMYRAHMDLYMGINAYRGPRDRYIVNVAQDELSSLDDYKNWQMEQVNILAFTDDFLLETLERLQALDTYWESKSVEDLYFNLKGSWRNAGRWHLSAEFSQEDQASNAVQVWAEVIDERVSKAISHARQVVVLDTRIVAIADQQTDLETRLQALTQAQIDLAWASQDLEDSDDDQPWDSFSHWHLLSQVTQASDWNPGWQALLDAYPAPNALPSEYLLWVERALSTIENELEVLPSQIETMQAQFGSLSGQYQEEIDKSLALSSAMEIELPDEVKPQTDIVRPASTLMLVGGILGVLAGLFIEIVRLSWGGED